MTLSEITKQLDLTPRRAQQLAAERIFVKTSPGSYDLTQSAVNYALFLRRTAGSEAVLQATLEEVAACVGESIGNARSLARKGMFKKLSHGRFDLIESVRNYITANKAGWRERGRPRTCSCGYPALPLETE